MQRERYPLDPLPIPSGSILLLPGGRCIVQLDPLPEDAPDVMRDYANRYLAVLSDLGHVAYVGAVSEYATQREAHRD